MITLQEIRDLVWADLDMDSGDLPELLVDRWIRNRYTEIVKYYEDWTFFEIVAEVITESGTTEYDLEGDALVRIESVIGEPGSQLGQLDYRGPVEAQKSSYPMGISDVSRQPDHFSWDKNNQLLTLWPIPDGTYTLEIRGYRDASYSWLDSPSGSPDLPDVFEPALLYGVTADSYFWDDDPRSQAMEQRFLSLLTQMAMDDQKAPPLAGPLVMGGSRRKNGLGRPLAPGYDYMTAT